MPAAHEGKNEFRDCTWKEVLVRFQRAAMALMKYAETVTGDTSDRTRFSARQARKGVSDCHNRGVGEPSLLFEKVRNASN
jgi:hypothetical protein